MDVHWRHGALLERGRGAQTFRPHPVFSLSGAYRRAHEETISRE
jgi:hypothetical protein